MPFTVAGANAQLDGDFALGSGSPASVWVTVLTAIPPEDPARGDLTEPTDADYAAVEVTNDATSWPAAVGGDKANGTTIAFSDPVDDWGTAVAVAIVSAATGGTVYRWDRLRVARRLTAGSLPRFEEGEITFSVPTG